MIICRPRLLSLITLNHSGQAWDYDRNGNVLAEDSTSYAIYAIVSTSYVSATQEKLYNIQDSQFDKVADILKG